MILLVQMNLNPTNLNFMLILQQKIWSKVRVWFYLKCLKKFILFSTKLLVKKISRDKIDNVAHLLVRTTMSDISLIVIVLITLRCIL